MRLLRAFDRTMSLYLNITIWPAKHAEFSLGLVLVMHHQSVDDRKK